MRKCKFIYNIFLISLVISLFVFTLSACNSEESKKNIEPSEKQEQKELSKEDIINRLIEKASSKALEGDFENISYQMQGLKDPKSDTLANFFGTAALIKSFKYYSIEEIEDKLPKEERDKYYDLLPHNQSLLLADFMLEPLKKITNGDLKEVSSELEKESPNFSKVLKTIILPTLSSMEKNQVDIGMETWQVVLIKSFPKDISYTETSTKVAEQWVYSMDEYVYIENGVVTAIQR